jgi:hypothetical protein
VLRVGVWRSRPHLLFDPDDLQPCRPALSPPPPAQHAPMIYSHSSATPCAHSPHGRPPCRPTHSDRNAGCGGSRPPTNPSAGTKEVERRRLNVKMEAAGEASVQHPSSSLPHSSPSRSILLRAVLLFLACYFLGPQSASFLPTALK